MLYEATSMCTQSATPRDHREGLNPLNSIIKNRHQKKKLSYLNQVKRRQPTILLSETSCCLNYGCKGGRMKISFGVKITKKTRIKTSDRILCESKKQSRYNFHWDTKLTESLDELIDDTKLSPRWASMTDKRGMINYINWTLISTF